MHNNNNQHFKQNNPGLEDETYLGHFLIIMHFFQTPYCQRKLELECNKVKVYQRSELPPNRLSNLRYGFLYM